MQRHSQLVSLFFLISILVFISGVISYLPSSKTGLVNKTSLTERDLAIAEALSRGKKEYSFTSRFIPGLGYINNPDQYIQEQEEEARRLFQEKSAQ